MTDQKPERSLNDKMTIRSLEAENEYLKKLIRNLESRLQAVAPAPKFSVGQAVTRWTSYETNEQDEIVFGKGRGVFENAIITGIEWNLTGWFYNIQGTMNISEHLIRPRND